MTNKKLTNKQAIGVLDELWPNPLFGEAHRQAFEIGIKAIKALEQEPCDDVISRQAVNDLISKFILEIHTEGGRDLNAHTNDVLRQILRNVKSDRVLPPVTPQPNIGHCRECRWWKDSDGVFRRGSGAESQCPMNRKEVYEGNGYCYMFEPKESDDNE